MTLTPDELRRYSRHVLLDKVGAAGQERLKTARVVLIGTGGLGSPAALYLAAAGVGTLGLVDFDAVDVTNLQRQIIHGTGAIGRSKLESARDRLADLNPLVHVESFDTKLTSSNAMEILTDFDLVIDGSDNFPTRYLVNDACALLGKPDVYGAIFRFEGQVSVFDASDGPCYRCLFRDPPPPGLVPSCAEAGVIGVLPGIIGSMQALEAIKVLLGLGNTLRGRLVLFDALAFSFREMTLSKDPECPLCGPTRTINGLIDYERFCGMLEPSPQPVGDEITVQELHAQLAIESDIVLLDVREPVELAICQIEGSVAIPLAQLPHRMDQLSSNPNIVTICHTGVRSLHAVRVLRQGGFARVRSLRGGIDAWAATYDPTMPRY